MKPTLHASYIALSLLTATPVLGAAPSGGPEPIPVPEGAALPQWPAVVAPTLPSGSAIVRSGELEVVQSLKGSGGFEVRVGGRPFAVGQGRPMVGYVAAGQLRWVDLGAPAQRKLTLRRERDSVLVGFTCGDADGGTWHFDERFSPSAPGSAIEVQVSVTVDRDRAVAFLPMFMVFPGVGSFGSSKGQGLLAGLEYLEDEPSSSEADIIGPASHRQVPDNLKLTFPLMVIQKDGRYLALSWETDPRLCALYDSPDRTFSSGGHVMGVLFPGSDGKNRVEGSLLPRRAELLTAGQVVVAHVTLMSGAGKSVVPAVQQYVRARGLPALPAHPDLQPYLSLAAGGWLDSKLREGSLVRHAVAGGNFPPGPAADAAVWMDWLAGRTQSSTLAERLGTTAKLVREPVPPADLNQSGVGHVRYPVASLIYGHVAENADRASQIARSLLDRFDAQLAVKYRAQPGGPDYGKTHFSDEANGFTSRPVVDLLQAAAVSGERDLIEAGLKRLRAMDKFHDGVPRGAQTWECPLHIPDILASAQMVRAYTLGYELSGDPECLVQARYWAWTGVPFVYLTNPTSQPVGPYGTIAVLGATQWKAPVWLGLPVQWCGLVYSEALYRLARHDPDGIWKKLADGITVSGIQQSWPAADTEMQGLLPDSFVLRAQHRNGPAINPATLLASAIYLFGQTPVYDFWSFRQSGVLVHVPGAVLNPSETAGRLGFEAESWVPHPYFVLISGLKSKPELEVDGRKTECSAPHQFREKEGQLILQLDGRRKIQLAL